TRGCVRAKARTDASPPRQAASKVALSRNSLAIACLAMPHTAHTVLVVGAGASVAEAKGFRPKRDRDHPPLDADFFARAGRHTADSRLSPIVNHAADLGQ